MDVFDQADFWGVNGRIARVQTGELAGRYVFVYPEKRAGWWTFFVAPTRHEIADDHYIDDVQYMREISSEGSWEWLPLDASEAAVQAKYFALRPLKGAQT